jgi:hypothetical protein
MDEKNEAHVSELRTLGNPLHVHVDFDLPGGGFHQEFKE